MKSQQKRPKFLNLFAIHLPVTGLTSIAHRISGALLALSIPVLIYLFGLSIGSAESFAAVQQMLQQTGSKIILTLLAWAAGHHLLAGIRYLLTDLDIGGELRTARASAWIVNTGGLLLFVLAGIGIWL